MGLTKETVGSRKQILATLGAHEAENVTLSNAGIIADSDGKKIIPAGTILGHATENILIDGVVAVESNDANAQAILKDDVDVTGGTAPGVAYYVGNIKTSELPTAPSSEAKAALKRITFK